MDGLPCRKHTKAEWEVEGKAYCHTHWARRTGRPQPQEYRRKVKAGSVSGLLGAFGLGKQDVIRLREAVPEVDSIMAKNTTLVDALDLTAKALALRLISKPDRATADSLAVLVKVVATLRKLEEVQAPAKDGGAGFRDLFAEGD